MTNTWNWIKQKVNGFKRWIVALFVPIVFAAVGSVAVDNQINPFVELPDRFEFVMENTLPEGGEAKVVISKNRPEITFGKWNDEVQLKVSYKSITALGNRPLFSNRVEWKGIKEELHVYPLPPQNQMEDGGFEIEIVLSGKPDTNVFEFEIEGAENLDFWYQPALTQEEIDEGVSRPENIVGSYAVYHKTKRDHRVGSINYATGKAFHIFRPKVVDSNGVEEWAALDYKNGILSVIVSQTFLDSKVYPIVVDPTFGFTTAGSSAKGIANEGGGSLNRSTTWGEAFTLSEDGDLTMLSAAFSTNNGPDTGKIFVAIYDEDSAGSGSHDLFVSAENTSITVEDNSGGGIFHDFSISGSITAAGSDYILAALGDGDAWHNGSFQQLNFHFDSTGGSGNEYNELTDGGGSYTTRKDEDPWTETSASSANRFGIFATYTAGGADRRIIIID